MPHLYVANMTKQHHQVNYRLLESTQARFQDIPIGSQVRLSGEDLSTEQIASIVKQLQPYGLKAVSEITRPKTFVGLCYSIGKPVKLDDIVEGVEKNDEVLNAQAEDRRATVAEAIANQHQQLAQEAGIDHQRTEVETIEDTRGTPGVASGVEVTAEGVEPRRDGRRRGPRSEQSDVR
ncbi:MAG TPA: hypothetical protein VI653_05000 [Steroidobacteraceae bacterium]